MKKKLLIVGEALHVLEHDKTFLHRAGCAVQTVPQWEDWVSAHGEDTPSVILVDMRGRMARGLEALRGIRKDLAPKKVPILAAVEKKEDGARCLLAGANDVVMTPMSQGDLLETISVLLDISPRRDPRVPVSLRVSYENLELFLTDYASNLSCGGIFIETGSPLREGTKIKLEFTIPEFASPLKSSGIVMWTGKNHAGMMGMGVQFDSLSPEAKKMIDAFIEKTVGRRI